MYRVILSKQYKKSLRKLQKSGRFSLLKVEDVVNTIAQGKVLDPRHKDHQLTGDLQVYRECHIESDVLLMYRLEKNILILYLINVGSHSQLF